MKTAIITAALLLSLGFGYIRHAQAVTASLSIVGTQPLAVAGYPDGYWSQVVFQSDPYSGGGPNKTRILWADCQTPGGSRRNSTPDIDRQTGQAGFPFITGEVWASCTAYVAMKNDWTTQISPVVTFSIP